MRTARKVTYSAILLIALSNRPGLCADAPSPQDQQSVSAVMSFGQLLDDALLKLWHGVKGSAVTVPQRAIERERAQVKAQLEEEQKKAKELEVLAKEKEKPPPPMKAISQEAQNIGKLLDEFIQPGHRTASLHLVDEAVREGNTWHFPTAIGRAVTVTKKPGAGKTHTAGHGKPTPATAKRTHMETLFPNHAPEKAEPSFDLTEILNALKREHSLIDVRSMGELLTEETHAVTDHPMSEGHRLRLGSYYLLAGDYEGAAIEMRKAIALKPLDYRAHLLLGRILDGIGDRDTASMEFRRAIEIASNVPETHCAYADSLMFDGELSASINEYRRSIGAKPTTDAMSGLAEALIMTHDKIGSLKAARQAVSLDPNSARAHVALTKALLLNDNDLASMQTAKEAVLLGPSLADSHLALGRVLHAKGDVNGAVEEFKQAVALDPLSAQARNDLGYALYGKGDMLGALSEFRLALRLNPRLGEARNNLEIAIHGLAGGKPH